MFPKGVYSLKELYGNKSYIDAIHLGYIKNAQTATLSKKLSSLEAAINM